MSDKKIEKEILEEKKEALRKEREKNFKDYCNSHGHKPVTRRELLGSGLIGFGASMTAPTLAGMLMPRKAHAQGLDCPTSGAGESFVPFVTLNLAGGAMLAANYVPTDRGGQVLPSYNRMGLGSGATLPIETEFGTATFAGNGISRLLVELRAAASPTTLANTAFVAVPVRSRDDSSMNQFDASGMVAKAGLLGTQLPNLGRNSSTDTGVRQAFAKVKPPVPLIVGRYRDINGALNFGANGPLSNLSEDQRVAVLKLTERLSAAQVDKVNQNAGGRMLATLVQCALGKNAALAGEDAPNMDVRQDGALSTIWGVQNNTNEGDEAVVFGSMVKSGLEGVAGTINLDKGGYDYHNGTRTTGDQRDGDAGRIIGRILESAAALNKKVFIYVTSDGACRSEISDNPDAPWRSDGGSAGICYMLAYDPAGRPQTRGHQLGQFTEGQAADEGFITGGNPELAASAVFANYLKFNNRMDLVTPVLGNTFGSGELDQVVMFG